MSVPSKSLSGFFVVAMLFIGASRVDAQSSSLFGTPAERGPMTLERFSWTYQAPPEPKQLKLNDLVTVMVDEKSQVISEGEMDRRKKANGTMALKDWIKLEGLESIKPDLQAAGEPTISGEIDGKYRAEAEMETRDSMRFRIACRVVDIRPNGTLVLEGRREIRNNSDVWTMSLGGVVRSEDILPNNTILSENVADLRIEKHERGHVYDGYRRGWLQKFFDDFQPI
jgi:flagellar L-ring protein precursor FlgH